MEGANNHLNASTNLTVGGGGVGHQLCDYQGVSSEDPIAAIWWWMLPVEDDGSGVHSCACCIQWRAGGNCTIAKGGVFS